LTDFFSRESFCGKELEFAKIKSKRLAAALRREEGGTKLAGSSRSNAEVRKAYNTFFEAHGEEIKVISSIRHVLLLTCFQDGLMKEQPLLKGRALAAALKKKAGDMWKTSQQQRGVCHEEKEDDGASDDASGCGATGSECPSNNTSKQQAFK
jgi:hypothetical protein